MRVHGTTAGLSFCLAHFPEDFSRSLTKVFAPKKALLTSLIWLAALAGCNGQGGETTVKSQNTSSSICSSARLAGGWSESEISPQAQQALDFVLKKMNTAAKLQQIRSVRSQVVNGTNYAIEFQMDNGEVWNTIVYRSLKGDLSITQPAQLGHLCE
jgi:hypothetical protein